MLLEVAKVRLAHALVLLVTKGDLHGAISVRLLGLDLREFVPRDVDHGDGDHATRNRRKLERWMQNDFGTDRDPS